MMTLHRAVNARNREIIENQYLLIKKMGIALLTSTLLNVAVVAAWVISGLVQ